MTTKNKKLKEIVIKDIDEIMTNKTLPFSSSIYDKNNFKEFCEIKPDYSIKSIDRADLPEEFSDETCQFINLFRRKTAHEKTEWNIYIDYENNKIIHCFHGKETKVIGNIHIGLMHDKKILSIHNHPHQTYSAPSAANFDILKYEFEDYEIICSENEYWILEAKGYFFTRESIKKEISRIFKNVNESDTEDKNELYSRNLIKYINNLNQKIQLTKKEYR